VALLLAILATALDGWPAPRVFDEFAQILAGDTFARGRLSNPAHPMPEFFETFHVLQLPTYSSKYFPGHGLFLALGIVLGGGARLGQWMAFATMAPALYWMLAGWITRRGALAATAVFILYVADTSWASGYWGAAPAVTGSALLFGALPRITSGHRPRPRDAALMGLGIVMMALTRPFEGLALCLPLALFYAAWTLFPSRSRPVRLRRVALPTVLVVAAGGVLLGLHNHAVTGDPARSGYAAYEAESPGAPPFAWQEPVPAMTELRANERARLGIDMAAFMALREWWAGEMRQRLLVQTIPVYLPHVAFLGLLLLAPFGMRSGRTWLAAAAIATVAIATGLSSFYLPHYIGPALPPLLLLFAIGAGVLHRRSVGRWPAGRYATGILLATLVVLGARRLVAHNMDERELDNDRHWSRRHEALERHLRTLPGSHLVFVHYGASYQSQDEWVQNAADRTSTRVLWAHDLGDSANARLRELEPGRTAWRLVVEANRVAQPMLAPYDSPRLARPIPPDPNRGWSASPPY